MAYPVRHFDPQTIYFITSRTIQSRFLMAPSAMTNELLGGSLARAVGQCSVELFAYVFTSNHFHAMVRAPSPKAMSRFMQRLQSDIARKVGLWIDWHGRFFGRRYSSEPIVDSGAEVERLTYILAHGVKEGLVSKVEQWPGLSSVQALLEGGKATLHRWRNWTQRWKMERREGIRIDRFSKECPSSSEWLTLTPLPCWAHLPPSERSRLVRDLIAEIDARAPNKAVRKAETKAKQIVSQNPHIRSQRTKHTSRPKAHASSEGLWIEAVRRYRAFLAAFKQASRRWLAGEFEAEFPQHSFRPPAWSVSVRIV